MIHPDPYPETPDVSQHKAYRRRVADAVTQQDRDELARRQAAPIAGRSRLATGFLEQQVRARDEVYGNEPTPTAADRRERELQSLEQRIEDGSATPTDKLRAGYLQHDLLRRDARRA